MLVAFISRHDKAEEEENAVVPEAIAEVFLVGKPPHRLLCQGSGGILFSDVLNTHVREWYLHAMGENLIENKVLPLTNI